ncbi:MAG: hypothetical protein KDA89_01285 [Planctomycetaceae bacterium]|nr:hypothetical protein [Planctomycetaceae bacterium]
MTIQRTLLFSIATLLMTAPGNAQCHRSQRVIIGHAVHVPHVHVTQRIPVTSICPSAQTVIRTAQLPPAPSSVAFGDFGHVDELAARLETLMSELCLDMYYNYSHNPGFQETYTEAYSLYLTARYIHAAEHHADREAIRRQLGGADSLFHHVEGDVVSWSRIAHHQVGTLDITAKMQLAEDTLHHLMEDVGVSLNAQVPPAPGGIAAAPVPYSIP